MSKELEALKSIKGTIIASTRGDFGFEYYYLSDIESTKKHFDIIEEALKRNKPMKPIYEKDGTRSCPCCKGNWLTPNFKFCSECGQKLDWSFVVIPIIRHRKDTL